MLLVGLLAAAAQGCAHNKPRCSCADDKARVEALEKQVSDLHIALAGREQPPPSEAAPGVEPAPRPGPGASAPPPGKKIPGPIMKAMREHYVSGKYKQAMALTRPYIFR